MIYLFQGYYGSSIVYDENTLTEEEKENGLAIEELPIPENIDGFYAQIHSNKETKEVWYEYVEIIDENLSIGE